MYSTEHRMMVSTGSLRHTECWLRAAAIAHGGMLRLLRVAMVLAVATSVGLVGAAAVCPQTGVGAPDVVTLMASTTKPATVAWIVEPNCAFEEVELAQGTLSLSGRSIQRVDGVPTETTFADLTVHPLSRGADFSKATQLTYLKTTQVVGLILPASLDQLQLSGGDFTSITGLSLPGKLTMLFLTSTPLTSLRGVALPQTLTFLELSKTKLSAIDFAIPPRLEYLYLDDTTISRIERIGLPSTLKYLSCARCGLSTVRGVEWPKSLTGLALGQNPLANFEIRRSDLPLFQTKGFLLTDTSITQAKCADSTAAIVVFNGNRLCVIEDARFVAIYVNGDGITPSEPSSSGATTTTPGSTANPGVPQNAGSGSGRGNTGGSNAADPSGFIPPDTSSSTASPDTKVPSRLNGTSTTFSRDGSSAGSQDETTNSQPAGSSQTRSPRKGGSSSSATDAVTEESSSNSALILGGCCGAAVLLIVIILYVYAVKKRRRRDADEVAKAEYSSIGSLEMSSVFQSTKASLPAYLRNDVRNDKTLIPFRIEQSDLPLGKKLGNGSSSAVFKATFEGTDVAVKQLLPGVWDNTRKLSQFMDEIRMCAKLEHHKIVAFVGIAWSSVRDLSVIMEFMPRGNLHSLLESVEEPPSSEDWSRPWTPSQLKSKAAIAQDVTEAVVYLHSFNSPIVHRNLKARNVLLDDESNAKLSGFGISRESTVDDTMTGEIGTTAWVAPEVLRGERYDEKADIYSLGVLMVEMDRCEHPYASESALGIVQSRQGAVRSGQDVVHHVAHKNTQIAVLVSSGKLRPSVSSDCPASVASIVSECLSFDASSRPTSMEVFYRLRLARVALE